MLGLARGWRPNLFSGLQLWLQADSVTGNDGDSITTWPNTAPTGSANDVTQATAGNKPLLKKAGNGLNGHNVLRFDGTDDYFRGTFDPGSTGLTFFYVARTDGGATDPYSTVIGSGGPNTADNFTAGIRFGQALGNAVDGYGSGWAGPAAAVQMGAVGGIAANQAYVGSYRYDKIEWTVMGPNATTGAADTSFPAVPYQVHIGCEFTLAGTVFLPLGGDIAEVIIYNRALTDAEVFAVRWYLEQKYFNSTVITQGPGPKLWLDADTVAGSDGDAVSTWSDQSGLSNDYAQATGGNQPIVKVNQLNGHRCVRFASNNKAMTSAYTPATATGKTIAIVCKLGSLISTGYAYPYSFLNGTTHDILILFHQRAAWYPHSFEFKATGAGASVGLGSFTGDNTTSPQRILISYNGDDPSTAANYKVLYDGSVTGSTTGSPSLSAGLAEAASIIGGDLAAADPLVPQLDIFELLMWERQLSTRELVLVDNYLKTKYGL